jgi:hypothetical protein
MQVNLGRRRAVVRTIELEEIITRHGIKGTVTDLLSYCFLFICFGMFGVEYKID